MTIETRRYVLCSTLLIMLAVPIALAALPDMTPDRTEAARGWAAKQSLDDIRSLLPHLDSLSQERQRFAFARLSSIERSAYWRSRHTAFVESHTLSIQQRLVLKQVDDMLSPEYFDNPARFSALQRKLIALVRTQFPGEHLTQIVGSVPAPGATDGRVARAIASLRASISVYATDKCECSHEQVFECPGCSAQVTCDVVQNGCWTGWASWGDCYGLCRTV